MRRSVFVWFLTLFVLLASFVLSDAATLEIVSYSPVDAQIIDSVSLEVETNINASCRYMIDSSEGYLNMAGDGRYHNASLDTPDVKEYFVSINCSKDDMSFMKNFSFKRAVRLSIHSESPSGHTDDESPRLSFETNKVAVCRYSDDDDEEYMLMDGLDSTNKTSHYKELGDLRANSYKYRIGCVDADGLYAFEIVSFKIDTKKPSVVLKEPKGVMRNSKSMSFKYTPKDDYGLKRCYLNVDFKSLSTQKYESRVLNGKEQSFDLTGLSLEEGEYSWSVECRDYVGHSVESDEMFFTVMDADFESGAVIVETRNDEVDSDVNSSEDGEDGVKGILGGSFLTGGAIADVGDRVGGLFESFIFLSTLSMLFVILCIRWYTKDKVKGVSFEEDEDFDNVTRYDKEAKNYIGSFFGNGVCDEASLIHNFHLAVVKARRRKRLSRAGFAGVLGVPELHLRKIENGRLFRGCEKLILKIEYYLGVRIRK
jgi:hypothetical protein